MELTGLILALIATLFVGYAVPIWSKRRYALATSRKDDRFSENLTLLETSPERAESDFGPSSRPLLRGVSSSMARGGNAMSEENVGKSASSTRTRSAASSMDVRAAQEYSALRARRAAHLSREKVAAKRRLVTAGAGVVVAIVFAALAAAGLIGWLWMLVPAGFLLATLAASAVAGERTKKQIDADNNRIAELRTAMRRSDLGSRPATSAPRAAAAPERVSRTSESVEENPASGSTNIPQSVSTPSVMRDAAEITEQHEEQHSSSARRVSGGEWDFVPLPAPSYARKEKIVRRVVHPDTDIVSVQPLSSIVVPGRPTRATVPMAEEVVDTSTASNPTFKFDLDAVLDQRRAQ